MGKSEQWGQKHLRARLGVHESANRRVGMVLDVGPHSHKHLIVNKLISKVLENRSVPFTG